MAAASITGAVTDVEDEVGVFGFTGFLRDLAGSQLKEAGGG
jgi:hypothetical protein